MKNMTAYLFIIASVLTINPAFAHPGHDHSSQWSGVVHALFTANHGIMFILLGLVVSYLAFKSSRH